MFGERWTREKPTPGGLKFSKRGLRGELTELSGPKGLKSKRSYWRLANGEPWIQSEVVFFGLKTDGGGPRRKGSRE